MQKQLGAYFTEQGIAHAISIWNFPDEYSEWEQISGYRYLLQHLHKYRNRQKPTQKQVSDRLYSIFRTRTAQRRRQDTVLFEITDILLQFSPDRGNELLNIIRQIDEEKTTNKKEKIRTVYSDSQNVHNTEINKNVLKVAVNLTNKYKDILKYLKDTNVVEDIKLYLCDRFSPKKDLIDKSISHIKKSVGTFGIERSLEDVFVCLWMWIREHKNHETLEARLVDELTEAKGMCTTGYLARLVNVLQGFTDDKNLSIRISDYDHCKAVVTHYLNKRIAESENEDVIDGLIDLNDMFVCFIREVIGEKLEEWEKEYGEEFTILIPGIVNKYINNEKFKDISEFRKSDKDKKENKNLEPVLYKSYAPLSGWRKI